MTAESNSRTTLGALLAGFAYASDLAFGLQLEDSLRSCYLATRLAERLGVSEDERLTVYYTALLKDAGCTSWTSELARVWQTNEIVARRELIIFADRTSQAGIEAWIHKHVAPELPAAERPSRFREALESMPQVVSDAIANTAEVAGRIAQRLGMPHSVRKATRHLFEQWDGDGAPDRLAGPDIPLASRIVLPTFFVVPVHRLHGRESAIAAVSRAKGSTFDPDVIEALDDLARSEEFWSGLEGERIRERVLALEPDSSVAQVGDERVEEIALAFADFVDLKSPYAAAHSRRVAKIAEQLALVMRCAPEAVVQIRRAALMHDLGLVAIPSFTLEKPDERLTESEREQIRLHPYHGERILQRVPAMAQFAEMVGNHHEQTDGSGYYRGLRASNISLGAKIIAVADRLDDLTHDTPGEPALDLDSALAAIKANKGLDADVVAALHGGIGRHTVPPEQRHPAGLTQREVDVLRLAARGLTRAQIGADLSITENTVRHHLEHIYDKTGTTTRVGATLFAIENGLLG